jgi:hypothetical protein
VAVPARAAPVPKCTIRSATGKGKGSLAPFTADRSAHCGSLGSVAGDLQLPGGTRLTLAPRPPGLPPQPVRPTRGAWPVARLQAARYAPRASAGAASRSCSGPFEVEARTQRILWGVLPRASLTERSTRCRAGTGGVGAISHPFDELGSARPPSRRVRRSRALLPGTDRLPLVTVGGGPNPAHIRRTHRCYRPKTRWSVPSESIIQSSGLGGVGLAQAQDIVAHEPKIRRTKSFLMPHPPCVDDEHPCPVKRLLTEESSTYPQILARDTLEPLGLGKWLMQ